MFNIIFYKPQDDSRGLNDIKQTTNVQLEGTKKVKHR